MTTEQTFWLVWNPEGGAPTVKHFNEEKAVKEAQRLARLKPGREFFVLFAQTKYVKADVQCIRLEPEMPF